MKNSTRPRYATAFVAMLITLSLITGCATRDDKLRNNFYETVNSEWLQAAEIPDDRMGIENFMLLAERGGRQMRDVIEKFQHATHLTSEERKLVDLYNSYMNMERRNELGLTPIREDLDAIDACRTHKDLPVLFVEFAKSGTVSPVIFVVTPDPKDSTRHVVSLTQGGLGLSQALLTGEDERAVLQRGLYADHLKTLFSLAKISDPENRVQRILALEVELAGIQWSPTENRDAQKTYNKYDYATLQADLSQYSLDGILSVLGLPHDADFVVQQPSYLKALNGLFEEIDVSVWQDYLRARLLVNVANLLTEEFNQAHSDYSKKQGLVLVEPPKWKQGMDFMNSSVGMLLGKVYVENYFDQHAKEKIDHLVGEIQKEFKTAISGSSRFSEATKKKALYKLANMAYNVGCPDEWRDYSSLEIHADDLIGNAKRAASYEYGRNLSKIDKPVNRTEWDMSPHEVNAFYQPNMNKFVLLAAILQEPFFDPNGCDSMNYGGIGFVIAHEIGHGFDDQGSLYDADGNLNNWWTDEDRREFSSVKQRLIEQANNYEIRPGKHLNGELEIGEIIGDLNGAEIALSAYLRLAESKGLDLQQAKKDFLEQLARVWRNKYREEVILMLIENDPHPAGEYRANGTVKNMDAFHEVYETEPGDEMYLDPAKRVRLW